MDQKIQGQIRTALAALAGIAVYKGYLSTEVAAYVVGAGMFAITSLWSWKSKNK